MFADIGTELRDKEREVGASLLIDHVDHYLKNSVCNHL